MRPRPCGPGYYSVPMRDTLDGDASMRPRPCGPGYMMKRLGVLVESAMLQ